MEWIDWLLHGGQHLTATLALLTALLASGHAVIWKRDSRAAALWVGFIWLVPLLGALLYFILGVNRIKRRAILLRGNLQRYAARQTVEVCSAEQLATVLPAASQHLTSLASATSKLLSRCLAAPCCRATALNPCSMVMRRIPRCSTPSRAPSIP